MIGVKYCGTYINPSGYGSANRSFITSLHLSQVNVTTEFVSQMVEEAEYGWQKALCKALEDRKIDYKVKIIHLTPDCYPRYMEKGKYHVGHLFWETDRLPKPWIAPINKMQEIWTASEAQAQMMKNSGVTIPIYWFGQPLDTSWKEAPLHPFKIPNFDGTIFYSIFQWIERKNPKALITSYWKAFQNNENVILVIKTYGVNYSEAEYQKIIRTIEGWKQELNLPTYPKIHLVDQLLSTQDIFRLHKTGDVFVSTSAGEGWNIGSVEAGLMGKPIIALNQTGFAVFFPKEIFYGIDGTPVNAIQVPTIPWYTSDQKWLNINEPQLIATLQQVYNDPEEAKKRGEQASIFVKDNFNYWAVGQKMKDRLETIHKFL